MSESSTTTTGTEPFVPAGPIDFPPAGFYPPEDRGGALRHALRGVQLGAYDMAIVTWLLGLDDPTIRTITSLLVRARVAGSS